MAECQMDLPPPLTPPDCDLSGFGYMPLDIDRLRKSRAWLAAKRQPHLAFYMLNLWTAAWKETPAASLEDHDDVLADAAMCPPERWAELRAEVLRGFVKCSDGRLYHEIVAIKVLEAWLEKLSARISSGHGNAKKHSGKFDDTHLRGRIADASALLFALDPNSRYFTRRNGVVAAKLPKEPSKPRSKKAGKPNADAGPADSLPSGIPAGDGQDPGGVAIKEKVIEENIDVGGKPPTTPGAGAPDGDGTPDGMPPAPAPEPAAPPATSPRAAKSMLKPAFVITLPDWMPVHAWNGFVDMRMRMGKSIPFTEAAAWGIVKKLEKLRDEGHDVSAMLEASTVHAWRDVFAPKGTPPTRFGAPSPGRYAGASAAVFGRSDNKGVVIDA